MTRAKITDQTTEIVDDSVIDIGESGFDDISDLQKDIDQTLDQIFMEFGCDDNDESFRIDIRRIMQNKGEQEHCFSCLPSELPIKDRIANEYGPGRYEIWIYKNGRIFKRPKLNIAAKLNKPERSAGETTDGLTGLITAMAEQSRQQFQDFQQMLVNQRVPAAPDPTAMMTGLMGMIVQMKEFLGPPPVAPSSNQFDMFLKAVEVVKDISGDSGERTMGDTIVDLAKEFGPGLMQMSNQLAAVEQAKPTGFAERSDDLDRSVSAAPSRPDQQGTLDMRAFEAQLNMLVQKAALGADPSLYADLILDNVPESVIRENIARPDMIAVLTKINPAVADVAGWFELLRSELLSGLDDSLTTGGNSEHNAVNMSTQDKVPTGETGT